MPSIRRVALALMLPLAPLSPLASLAAQGGGAASAPWQPGEPLTLARAVALAQTQGNAARAALAQREAARQRDRAFGATLRPQVGLAGNLPIYNRSIIPVLQPDGSTIFRPQQQNESAVNMTVSQRLPLTGGDLFVTSSLSRLEVIGERDTRTWSSTPMSVGIRQDILRPNRQGWDNREQEIRAEVAERQFREAMEDIAISTANAFFDYYSAKVALANAVNNAAVNDTLFTLNKGRYEVGRIGENDLLQSELALLRSRTTLDGARLEYDRTLAALRLALNLPIGSALEVAVPAEIPRIVADTLVAVTQALRNRSQVAELELGEVQARRRVTEARLNTGFGASVQASLGFNQTAPEANLAYQDLREAQRFSLAVNMPLVQWGGRSAQIQAAKADADRQGFTARNSREVTEQEAHFAALQLSQSERQLVIAAKADTVGTKRFDVAKNRYVIGRIGMDNLYQAQTEKDAALTQYLGSLRGYWIAYYRLRRVTMWDFERGVRIGR